MTSQQAARIATLLNAGITAEAEAEAMAATPAHERLLRNIADDRADMAADGLSVTLDAADILDRAEWAEKLDADQQARETAFDAARRAEGSTEEY